MPKLDPHSAYIGDGGPSPSSQGEADGPEPDDVDIPGDRSRLRSGFTTGTAATAAAMAAACLLSGDPSPSEVTVKLRGGGQLTVPVNQSSIINENEALATVIKDAGDDPDVTNKAVIGAVVRRRKAKGLIDITGGPGVGKITKPGLVLPPGQWAINPGPREMLQENLAPFINTSHFPGVEVEIFVERGDELAAKTLNPRLGIIGGLSILGTTGLVKPFSNQAYIETVKSSLDQARALGLEEIVLTTGRQSEKLGLEIRPDLGLESFVQIADFFGDSLQMAAERQFERIGLSVFFGKAVKQAAGHHNTHAHKNDQDTGVLAGWLSPKINKRTAEHIKTALTARGALEILRKENLLALVPLVASKALGQARKLTGPGPDLWMILFDYDGSVLAEETLPGRRDSA